MSQNKIGRTLVALLVTGFLALILVAGGTLWLAQRTQTYTELTALAQEIKTSATRLLSAAQDAETGHRGYLLTQNEAFLAPFRLALVQLPAALQELRGLTARNDFVQDRIDAIEVALDEKLQILTRTLSLAQSGRLEEAVEIIRAGRGKEVMDQVRLLIGEIEQAQDELLAARSAEATDSGRWFVIASLLAVLLITGLAVACVWIVRRFVRDLGVARADLEQVNRGLEGIVEERTGEIMRANEEIQRFAYIVSHDLRAPLVNVMGFTSELEAAGETMARQQEIVRDKAPELLLPDAAEAIEQDLPEAIGFIRASTSKMDRLINAILKLSREGRRILAPERVPMHKMVQNIADSLQHQAAEANAEIVVDTLPDLATDRLAIEQVFSNLIENAVKYLDRGRPGRVTVSGRENGIFIDYEVADNGRGIDAKDHERVFELFRRAGTQDTVGEGLGLAFVRASVRRLGGTLTLESALGEGSTFRMKFPKTVRVRAEAET